MGLKAAPRSMSGEVTTSYELLDVIFDGILAGAGGFSRPANRHPPMRAGELEDLHG